MGEPFGEQRADGTVNQARGEDFLLGRPAFAFEEAAGNASRGVGAFLVVDRHREEILPRHRLALRHDGDEHHGVAHAGEAGAAGLTRDLAGFEGDGMTAVLEGLGNLGHGYIFLVVTCVNQDAQRGRGNARCRSS